jgi:hypothetical protein
VLPPPDPRHAFLGSVPSPLEWRFSGAGAESLRVRPAGGLIDAERRQRSEAVDVDRRQLVCRRLINVAVIVNLHKLAPVDVRAACGRDRRRFEWFAQVLPTGPRGLPMFPAANAVTAHLSL